VVGPSQSALVFSFFTIVAGTDSASARFARPRDRRASLWLFSLLVWLVLIFSFAVLTFLNTPRRRRGTRRLA
jgi:hypothetical protein